MNTITEEEALNRMAAYCSAAEHCKAEVNEKLQKWGLPYEVINRIIDRLVVDKFRFAKWGKMKITQALYMKKIPREVTYRYLNDIDREEYLAILGDLIAAKRKSIHAKDEFELNGKLIRFAMSRGFEMDDIRRCVQVEEE